MKISIFGLGYVGCVTAACLAKSGYSIIGVDIDPHKVALINDGKPAIVEKHLAELVAHGQESGRLSATTSVEEAVLASEISLICVGTPSMEDGSPNLSCIQRVSREIGQGLTQKTDFHIIVIRSTVPPGTHEAIAHLIGEHSGKTVNRDFALVFNPEFLREGTAVKDFFNPPFTLLGSNHTEALAIVASLYSEIDAPVYRVGLNVAELIKYVSNSYHALKVTFANEIGNICKALSIDSHSVMEIFCKDTHLNISPAYLKPGFAYGGSCLPKDLRALVQLANQFNIETPVLDSIQWSNDIQKNRVVQEVLKQNCKQIGIIGLTFKPGTDDLRESPMVDVAEQLIAAGCQVKIYDRNLSPEKLTGSNKEVIITKLPQLSELLVPMECLIEMPELLLIGTHDFDYQLIPGSLEYDAVLPAKPGKLPIYVGDKIIVDLVRLENYQDFEQALNLQTACADALNKPEFTASVPVQGHHVTQLLTHQPVAMAEGKPASTTGKGRYVGLCW
jgi:GDP-mannose 6-dehydrogenase